MSATKQTANLTDATDPTGTLSLRQSFLQAIRQRFKRLRGLIRQTVGYENNALQIKQEDTNPLFANAEPRESFEFTTAPGRIREFMTWVEQAIEEEILEPLSVSENVGDHWTAAFIRSAYVAGFNRGTGLLFQQGASVDNPGRETILSRPIPQSTLQTLYTRTYENLQDITEDMSQVIRDELTTALAEGENPRKVADRLTREIRDMQHTRAETLARSEMMNAVTESTLDRFESAEETVGVVHSTWRTAGDSRVCAFCDRLDGLTFSVGEMRDGAIRWAEQPDWTPQVWRLSPPAHPNCRCALLPEVGATVEGSIADRISQIDGFERAEVIA